MSRRVQIIATVLWILAALALQSRAANVTLAWDAPTNHVDATPITPALAAELRYTVWTAPYGGMGAPAWTAIGTTTTSTNRLSVTIPAGVWLVGVTAQYSTNDTTRSVMSATLTQPIYARVMQVGGLRVLVVGE